MKKKTREKSVKVITVLLAVMLIVGLLASLL